MWRKFLQGNDFDPVFFHFQKIYHIFYKLVIRRGKAVVQEFDL